MTRIIEKRLLVFMLAMVMTTVLVPTLPAQAAAISIGEYVQMGTYYGESILWRCVDIDENGPLMLADKILCIKAFDAETSNNQETGSHSRDLNRQSYGSNYWGDSNMRSWLNSTASVGNIEWLCGNPPVAEQLWNGYNAYDQEAGFLSNFTESERNAMKAVTQKSLLSYPEIDAGMAITGTEQPGYDDNIEGVVTNYDTAYAEYVTDKMFLMDVKQVNAVYNNGSILGDDYYIGEPTAQCVANSEYEDGGYAESGKKWTYWLRSPISFDAYYVRYVSSLGRVRYNMAYYDNTGVRPAFYLDLSSFSIASGAGTESNPYVGYGSVNGKDSITVEKTVTDDTISFVFTAENTDILMGVRAYAAKYSDNELINVIIRTVEENDGVYSISFKSESVNGYKIMIWDSDYSPITEVIE